MGFFNKVKNKVETVVHSGTSSVQGVYDNTQKAIDKAKKDAEAKIKKIAEEKRKKEKAIQDKIAEALNKIKIPTSDIPYVSLIPFKPLMIKMLKKRNISFLNTLSDIAPKFYKHVILNHPSNTEQLNVLSGGSTITTGSYIPTTSNEPVIVTGEGIQAGTGRGGNFNLDEDEEKESTDPEQKQYTQSGSTASQYEGYAKQTKGVVKQILAWFKERKAKKEAKKQAEAEARAKSQPMPDNYGDMSTPPLTDEEGNIITDVDEILKQLEENAKKDVENEDSEFSVVEIILGIAGVVGFIALCKYLYEKSKGKKAKA